MKRLILLTLAALCLLAIPATAEECDASTFDALELRLDGLSVGTTIAVPVLGWVSCSECIDECHRTCGVGPECACIARCRAEGCIG